MLVMLVESRHPFDDGTPPRREPWLVTMLERLLPWPALIVWLCVTALVIDGWPAVGCAFTAIALAAWRGLCALPTEGLDQQRQ